MKAAITVELDGATFVLDEGAYRALRSYLDRAASRLGNHPDRAEVIAGLERSISAKLARGPAAQGVALAEAEMSAALREVGRVDGPELGEGGAVSAPHGSAARPGRSAGASSSFEGTGSSSAAGSDAYARPRARRLYRLKEGQQVAGVCIGLAAYSEIDVGLIRFLFLVGFLFSGGLLLLAYVVLAFVMPIARTEAEVAAARGGVPAG
jgi:phage shock protein PspC (stress-responsive transcriptional regulator)